MSATDELLRRAARAQGPEAGALPSHPALRTAVVACMDARLDPVAILGLEPGDVHVLRNAGGVVTDDVIRSLVISQRLLGTEEVMLVHHTDCGMLTLTDDQVRRELELETGIRPHFAFEAFDDLDSDLRQCVARIRASPFVPAKAVRAFVYDLATGRLREVA